MNSLRWIRKEFDYQNTMNVVLLHCKQYTRGAFNHNCSDINIHKNSTKTIKIIYYATYITAFLLFIMLLVSFSLSHFGDDCIS